MPLREIPYRCVQTARKTRDKYLRHSPSRIAAGESVMNVPVADLRGIETAFPRLEAELKERAARVLEHRFDIFGIDVALGGAINWHLDPKTGKQWPLEFWGDIDYRDGTRVGGVKFAWELNRLHHFPVLATAHRITGNPVYKRELFEQLACWLAGNPYPRGINWISGIELGIRLVNVVYSLKFLGIDALTAPERQTIFDFVSLHGRHLRRYPSRYSSCANHVIAEALGLYVAGLSFPGLPGADDWRRLGRSTLEEQIPRQIQADGSGFECSVPYLAFIAEHVLIYLLLSRCQGERPGARVEARLCAALDYMASIMDSRGHFPHIGDGDDACVLQLLQEPHANHLSLLNAGAVLFNRPHWLTSHASYDWKTFCLLGAGSHARWRALQQSAVGREFETRHFEAGGYVVIRDGPNQTVLVGNGSPLGLPPLGGHGHADALSIWLSVGGRPFLVDPGTYLYHDGGKWRRYFRSTAAHNTLRVDGQDQATMLSDFMFRGFYRVRDAHVHEAGPEVIWSAWHDGYQRLSDPVVHGRVVTYSRDRRCITIADTVRCRGRHAVECFFHFHPDCRVSVEHDVAIIQSGEVELVLQTDRQWESCRLVRGQAEPVAGWYSSKFNEKSESSTLICRKNIEGTTVFRTVVLLPSNPQNPT